MLGKLKNLFGRNERPREELEHEGDPRGGLQAEEYRTADPRDIVVEGDVAMSGPGGSPQEDTEPQERDG